MYIELLGRKILSLVTPYKRVFFSIQDEEFERVITLPSIKSASYFISSGDILYIDSIDDLEKLCWIDYDLVNSRDKHNIRHNEDFLKFKDIVKSSLSKNDSFKIVVGSKIIMSDVLHLACNIIHEDTISSNNGGSIVPLNNKLEATL